MIGAGHHAVSTAQANIRIVKHGAFRSLFEGVDQANRSTARFIAMHALVFAVHRGRTPLGGLVSIDDRKLRGRDSSMTVEHGLVIDGSVRRGVPIDFFACFLAGAGVHT